MENDKASVTEVEGGWWEKKDKKLEEQKSMIIGEISCNTYVDAPGERLNVNVVCLHSF